MVAFWCVSLRRVLDSSRYRFDMTVASIIIGYRWIIETGFVLQFISIAEISFEGNANVEGCTSTAFG